jgi:hypothetical protein
VRYRKAELKSGGKFRITNKVYLIYDGTRVLNGKPDDKKGRVRNYFEKFFWHLSRNIEETRAYSMYDVLYSKREAILEPPDEVIRLYLLFKINKARKFVI